IAVETLGASGRAPRQRPGAEGVATARTVADASGFPSGPRTFPDTAPALATGEVPLLAAGAPFAAGGEDALGAGGSEARTTAGASRAREAARTRRWRMEPPREGPGPAVR